jgi:rifampicin phosphotransferase
MKNLRWLGDSEIQAGVFGAKAANLSRLTDEGVRVPKGFAISSQAYLNYQKTQTVPADLLQELEVFLRDLDSPQVIVRSSAIGEDGGTSSYAGQLQSFIADNTAKDVVEKLQLCWRSLEGDRVKTYEVLGTAGLTTMGVVIQPYREPAYAGVLFTHDPSGSNKTIIEYVPGFAGDLVEGRVTPETVTCSSKDLPTNAPFQIAELIDASQKVLKIFSGVPQDIEWIELQGQIHIVQARPITRIRERVYWSNTNVNENFPDPLFPFQISFAREGYQHYFRNLGQGLGLSNPQSGSMEYSSIIGFWNYRMYYNMTSIHRLLQQTPFADYLRNSFDDFIGFQGAPLGHETHTNSWAQKAVALFKMAWHSLLLPIHVITFESTVSRFSTSYSKAETLRDLSEAFHEFLEIRFQKWRPASFADFFAMIYYKALELILARVDSKSARSWQGPIVQGLNNLVSHQPLLKLWDLRELIFLQGHEDLFRNENADQLWKRLQSDPALLKLKNSVDDYIKDWGFRCPGELVLTKPSYTDDPRLFLSVLQSYLKTEPQNPRLLLAKQADQARAIKRTVLKSIAARFWRRPLEATGLFVLFSVVVPLARLGIASRERVRLKQALAYQILRTTMNGLGQHLQKRQSIREAMDLHFLTFSEISMLLNGESSAANQALVDVRRNAREKDLSVQSDYPDDFFTYLDAPDVRTFENKKAKEDSDVLSGLSACGGVVTASARVIQTLDEIHLLRKGEILVTRQTDPGWICAFPLISGLIVERGGLLSHSAIVAREFGVPTVVGVRGATDRLVSGQVIRMNADAGVIECLPS